MQEPKRRRPEGDIQREARLLLRAARMASLAVIEDGWPGLSLVTPAVALDGDVILLLSRLAAHTGALDREPRCSLLVSGKAVDENPQTRPRLSLACEARRSEDAADRGRYLAIHPYAAPYAGFADFGVYRLHPIASRYVGGFGRAASPDVARLAPATAALRDIDANRAAIAVAERDHGAALDALARRGGGTGEGWKVAALDADGFDLSRETRVIRYEFERELRAYDEFMSKMPKATLAAHG
ncbi:MAG: HugZ family pyridoxamine 5'-phosphate oxidase [Acidiphilium sp.]